MRTWKRLFQQLKKHINFKVIERMKRKYSFAIFLAIGLAVIIPSFMYFSIESMNEFCYELMNEFCVLFQQNNNLNSDFCVFKIGIKILNFIY